MSFFDKLKSGVADAGNKAKIAVEVNRLKMQNSSKRKEIEQIYVEIGKATFLSVTGRGETISDESMNPHVQKIIQLETEIHANLQQIKSLSDERDCICGKVVSTQTRFCPNCGHDLTTTDLKEVNP